ncbi:unnamed protein product [Durusdinium trenchii]|uniref:ADP-ribosylglycohydrolase n=1 Tax=Durusdinium trenchii TaxID=1381693 RepID=A0ABP0SDK4_9DINO
MTEETSALLAELTTFLRDEPELVKVNRQLKDKGDRDVKLVEFSPWSQVPDELIERARSLIFADTCPKPLHRAAGALLGLAVADWVGAPLEFLEVVDEPSASCWDHDAFTWRNPNKNELERGVLKPGQWTDDTSMALCLADSLALHGRLDGSDLRLRFWCWFGEGMNNPFRFDAERGDRRSFGLGLNTAKSLMALKPLEPIEAIYVNPGSSDSGNGGLMRLAPVAIFFPRLEEALDAAAQSSLTTHPGALATEAARYLAFLLHSAIHRGDASEVEMSAREFLIQTSAAYAARLDSVAVLPAEAEEQRAAQAEVRALATSSKESALERCWNWQEPTLDLRSTFRARGEKYNGHPVSRCYAGSYCMDGLAMALHAVASTDCFDRAIEKAVNFLGDADTVGAIAGQLAGAFYGASSIDARTMVELLDDDCSLVQAIWRL